MLARYIKCRQNYNLLCEEQPRVRRIDCQAPRFWQEDTIY